MFKKVDRLKKGQYVRISGQLFMLGYKGYTPMLMHCMLGTVMQGSAVKSVFVWSGMDDALFRRCFDKHRLVKGSTAIEFLELVEDEATAAPTGIMPSILSGASSIAYALSTPVASSTTS